MNYELIIYLPTVVIQEETIWRPVKFFLLNDKDGIGPC
jgi:hypothetical protein